MNYVSYSVPQPPSSPIILNNRLEMIEDLSVLPRTVTHNQDEFEYSGWAQPYSAPITKNKPTCKGHKNGYRAGAFGKKNK